MRAKIVSRSSLNALAKKIGLKDLIEYSKSSNMSFTSIQGNAFEALTGALYLDKGYQKTYDILVKRVLTIYIDVKEVEQRGWNYKSILLSSHSEQNITVKGTGRIQATYID